MADDSASIWWTERADRDLGRAILFVEEASPAAAEQWVAELLDRVALLQSQPELGAPVEFEGEASVYRRLIVRRYAVYYRHERDANRIIIIRVWHTSRDPAALYLE